ncbi:MAG: response regulator [Aquincola sp.]|nr:response regulator [Aquincola sp.]MDH4290596.1 response regulator [Aquincola sp.]MDH5328438.1 response regulator [Aquincola sp.]
MPSVLLARRDALLANHVRGRLESSRAWRVLGVVTTLYRARKALPGHDPDAVVIDLRMEDGAALSLVHQLRERHADRPKVMLLAASACDPLLFSTLAAGADGYLLESDLTGVSAALLRMMAGEATMASALARQALHFFGEMPGTPSEGVAEDRALDWHTDGANPMRLSPGERRLVQMLAQGTRATEVAARMALSAEAVGRRIGMVYRKLSWDVKSGSLSLRAA